MPTKATRVRAWAVAAVAVLSAPASMRAENLLKFEGLGIQSAAVAPSGWDAGWAVNLHLDLGRVGREIVVQPSLGYSNAKTTTRFLGADFHRELIRLSAGADFLWYPIVERRGWYAGLGAYLERQEYDLIQAKRTEDQLAAHLVGGYDFLLGTRRAFVEGRYQALALNTVQVGVGLRIQ